MINKYISFPLILMIRLYQLFISPLLGQNCRYLPTCSEYSVKSLKEHGLFRGSILSIKRISKCHPWGSHRFDPVPKKTDLNK